MIVPQQRLRGGCSILELLAPAQHPPSQGPLLYSREPFDLAMQPRPADLAGRLEAAAASVLGVTDHALLLVLGQFAQKLGLLSRLQQVPIRQRTVDHTPQAKLIQFFVAILAGLDYLHDFTDAPHPLCQDHALIASWGQEAFAHYSSLSRTLAAADEQTLNAVQQAVQTISQPFVEAEVSALMRQLGVLLIDIDLTGREVSPMSTSYVDADFGWMDDKVRKGYQALVISLSGGPSVRLLLQGCRYGGRTQSAEVLRSAVGQLEAQLGSHPRRRTEVVQARIEVLERALASTTELLAAAQTQQRERLCAPLRGRQTAKGREKAVVRLGKRIRRLEGDCREISEQIGSLRTRLVTLREDNARPQAQLPIVLRLDAGFSSDENLSHLIEMGYTILTKAHSGQTTQRLLRCVEAEAVWTPVGKNAEALSVGPQLIAEGAYALHALLVRYQLPEAQRATTLLYYGDTPPPSDLALWFGQYNARQIIEAGIKEGKHVFTLRRPLVRSPYGMQLQELLSTFAANFVRWAAGWLREHLEAVPNSAAEVGVQLQRALSQIKSLIRVVAHCRAWLVETPLGRQLIFDAAGPFAGAIVPLSDQVTIQLVLPVFHGSDSAPGG